MKISKAYTEQIIPEKYKGIFPEICPVCGEELDITENLTKISCSNPFCGRKSGMRLASILANFGVKGIGEATAEDLMLCVERFHDNVHDPEHRETHDIVSRLPKEIYSPLEVFYLPLHYYPYRNSSYVNKDRYDSIHSILKKQYNFPDVASNLGLPGFNKTALTLFKGYSSYADFMSTTDEGATLKGKIRYLLGYGETAEKVINVLDYYVFDFLLADELFTYLPKVKKEMQIVITGAITKAGNYTRKEFVDYINRKFAGKVHVVNGKALTTSDYIIADAYSNSTSYKAGMSRQKNTTKEVFINSKRFVEILKEMVGDTNE